jgi:hypothetical protein
MSTEDTTQIPPAGQAIPPQQQPPPGVPEQAAAAASQGSTARSSSEKVQAAVESLLAAKGPVAQAFLTPLLGTLNLPEEASQLDQLLLEGATYLLTLRSDGAAPYAVTSPTAQAAPGVLVPVKEALEHLEAALAALKNLIEPSA